MFGVDDLDGEEVVMETTTDVKNSAAPTTYVYKDEVTMAQALAALKTREREEFSKVEKARLLVELIKKRKKHFATLRAQEKRSKPPTKTQMKSQMSTYLRHMGGYKQSHLKGRSFDEIKELFDREMTKVDENVEPAIDDYKALRKCIGIFPDDGDEADDCDAFGSDMDEAPTAPTMFIANLLSADPVTDEAGPSYDLDILSEYVKDNEVPVVHSNVSSVPNDAFMMIYDDMVFSVATNSELNVARFTDMIVAHTAVEARCLELEVELAKLHNTSHHDNQEDLINCFSKLKVNHLNLQLKYQNLKDSFGNNPSTPDKDTPDFDSVFVIGKMQAFLQGKDNVIRQLKKQISQLQVTRADTNCTLKVLTIDSQITKLTKQVTNLQAQNNLFRVENDKIKQHYKELYDSIKITGAKHIEQATALTTENVNLKAQTLEKVNSVSKD
uniref:Uncharacterized protein n=1 Tax=Tanacetum cinerariifolium TaxID=118510 RepID=A0A699IGB3_TANCI|nr:hypothetical protein [Tanacetum cinerariifolium]